MVMVVLLSLLARCFVTCEDLVKDLCVVFRFILILPHSPHILACLLCVPAYGDVKLVVEP